MVKRALLIGINYHSLLCKLKGCINDIIDIFHLLVKLGYEEFLCLYDGIYKNEFESSMNTKYFIHTRYPTKYAIIESLIWLTSNLQPNDQLFLHYSGHGSLIKQTNYFQPSSVENTIFKNAIVPADYLINGIIEDKMLHDLLIKPIVNRNIHLLSIFDCCHSKRLLNLKYNLQIAPLQNTNLDSTNLESTNLDTLDTIKKECLKYFKQEIVDKYLTSSTTDIQQCITNLVKETIKNEYLKYFKPEIVENILSTTIPANNSTIPVTVKPPSIEYELIIEKVTDNIIDKIYVKNTDFFNGLLDRITNMDKLDRSDKANIILLSGCDMEQTSADACFTKPNGALTANFCELYNNYLANNNDMDLHVSNLLFNLHKLLKDQNFTQIPQISSEYQFNKDTLFKL